MNIIEKINNFVSESEIFDETNVEEKATQFIFCWGEKKEIFILKIKLYLICHKQNFYFLPLFSYLL